jgi:hypothetical protein
MTAAGPQQSYQKCIYLRSTQMQNVNNTTSATQAAATKYNPYINIAQLGVHANVVADDKADKATPIEQLKSLEVARISWETTELAASNNRLYSILKKAYSFYLVMKTAESKDVRKERFDALEAFIKEREYTFMPSTHDMTRVVKCVFGVDRRRVSAYSLALREALRQEIDADDLIAFIEDEGGVEQIRMGGTKPLSANKRADRVRSEVFSSDIGTFKVDATLSGANADWVDKQVIIVATYLPTGEFEANAVIKHDSAVNAALAAHYTNQQAAIRAQFKAEKDSDKEAQAAQKSARKAEKMAKQIASVEAEKAAAERANKNLAHTNTLFEGALA